MIDCRLIIIEDGWCKYVIHYCSSSMSECLRTSIIKRVKEVTHRGEEPDVLYTFENVPLTGLAGTIILLIIRRKQVPMLKTSSCPPAQMSQTKQRGSNQRCCGREQLEGSVNQDTFVIFY